MSKVVATISLNDEELSDLKKDVESYIQALKDTQGEIQKLQERFNWANNSIALIGKALARGKGYPKEVKVLLSADFKNFEIHEEEVVVDLNPETTTVEKEKVVDINTKTKEDGTRKK